MNRRTLPRLAVALLVIALLLPAAVPAAAESIPATGFESPTYTVGNIDGQDGWSKTGSYDVAVVANTYGYATFGAQSLRISNAVASGAFGDQTFAKPLVNAVGETAATAATYSVGVRQNHFEMQFDIASTQATQQPGLLMSVSPDRGDGSRMSYLRFEDAAAGIDVFFDDVPQAAPCTPSGCANFVESKVGSGLSRTAAHTIKLTMDTLDGPSNDVVKVYIDGALVKTGTSWEGYYRYDPEASAEQSPRIVKTVLFRAGGTAVPANSNKGFLIDNFTTSSSGTLTVTPGDTTWFFYDDGFPGGVGDLTVGPATPPLGVGSLHMKLVGDAREAYGTLAYAGTPLNQITRLEYSTYRSSVDAGNNLAIALQADLDRDLTDSDTSWQGRIVFEPYMTTGGAVLQNTWQQWDALAGKWWTSKAPPEPEIHRCPQASPCTLTEFLGYYPKAGIRAGGVLWLKAGGPAPDFEGNADALTVGVNGLNTTYDFEPTGIKPVTGAPTFCLGKNSTIDLRIEGVKNLYGYQIDLKYDASKASAAGAFDNSWFDTTSDASVPGGYNAACAPGAPGTPPNPDLCKFGASKVAPGVAVNGSGRIGTITFTGVQAGTFDLEITSSVLSDRDGIAINHSKVKLPLTVCGFATVSGKISLQGRATPIDSGTVTLTDNGGIFAPRTVNFSATDGTWSITGVEVMPTGSTYALMADHGLYLFNQQALTLTPGSIKANQNTRLWGGDANNDEVVGITDLSCIGGSFGGPVAGSCLGGSSDINADGVINIQDLSIAGGNYTKASPQAWQ